MLPAVIALAATFGYPLVEVARFSFYAGTIQQPVYVGTGNTLFTPADYEAFFPKKSTGVLHSFGLPGEDEVSRLGTGKE